MNDGLYADQQLRMSTQDEHMTMHVTTSIIFLLWLLENGILVTCAEKDNEKNNQQ